MKKIFYCLLAALVLAGCVFDNFKSEYGDDWMAEEVNAEYNIIYKNVGDADNSSNPASFHYMDNVTISDLSKVGYSFNGWYDAEKGGNKVTGWSAKTKTSDVTLWARWEAIRYTIVFDGNGGSGTMNNQSFSYDEDKALFACAFTAPVGYKFGSWNTDKNGSGASYQNSQSVSNLTSEANKTITLYAQWIEKEAHRIVYHDIRHADNSSNANTFFEMNDVVIYDPNNVTGYIFDGWYDAETDGNKVTGWTAGSKTSDVILYARWTPITYTIVFNSNGGSGSMSNQVFNYDISKPLTECGFNPPSEKRFVKWTTSADGSGTVYSNGQFIHNLTTESNTVFTLYAQWAYIDEHNITYNNLNGVNNSNPQVYRESIDVTLSDLSQIGYTFNGWYNASSGGTQVTGWTAGSKTSDVTLWARWTAKTYTITYKDEGNADFSGTHGTSYPSTHTYSIETTLVSPQKTSYRFDGWYTTSDCAGSPITSLGALDYTDNITLYAKWTLRSYTIRFNANGGSGSMNDMSMVYDESQSLTANAFTKDDGFFIGWNTSADGSGTNYTDKQSVSNLTETIGAVVTLYARWIGGFSCYASELSSRLASASAALGPYNIFIEDEAPDLSVIRQALTAHNDIEVFLNLTSCEGIEEISNTAFYNCQGLVDISLPDTVLSIGDNAFWNCTKLKNVVIPNSVVTIGQFVFNGCSSIESMTIPFTGSSATATSASKTTVFGYLFGENSFTGAKKVSQYFDYADYYIPNSLKSVTLTNNDRLLSYSFYNCSGLTSITIPDSVTSIGDSAFSDCSGLTSVTIPDTLTSIGNYAFYRCSGLRSVTIPDSVKSIGNCAFSSCSSLTSIDIPNSVTKIGWNAFSSCSGLKSVTIPDSWTSISQSLFDGCSGLTSVTIPDSVTSIGMDAFENCSRLKTMTVKAATPPSYGMSMLYGCNALTTIYVPLASVNAYKSAGGWKDYVDKIQPIE